MSLDQYIPAGRTSLVKQGELDLQLQTEYAYRPRPRITTTISISGRVVQKIERELSEPIDNEAQQARVQRTIVRQHAEVISLIKKRVVSGKASLELETNLPKHDPRVVPDTTSINEPASENAPQREVAYQNIPEKLMNLPGVRQIFRLTNDGEFVEAGTAVKFKKAHRKIFKNLADLMELYGREAGGIKRTVGVYEVQPERLYFASSGIECYFIVIDEPSLEFSYEIGIRDVLTGR